MFSLIAQFVRFNLGFCKEVKQTQSPKAKIWTMKVYSHIIFFDPVVKIVVH
jgi:hypothetical protein